jgi:hypothetical protein
MRGQCRCYILVQGPLRVCRAVEGGGEAGAPRGGGTRPVRRARLLSFTAI